MPKEKSKPKTPKRSAKAAAPEASDTNKKTKRRHEHKPKKGNTKKRKTEKQAEPAPQVEAPVVKVDNSQMYRVHRCRFIDWKPHAIVCLAFNADGSKIAVGRDTGDIELWSVAHGWVCEKVIPGTGEATVQSILWLERGDSTRLFSTGLNGVIIEWDLSRLRPKSTSDSFGGAVWSACLRVRAGGDAGGDGGDEAQLALACEDGSVRLFTVGQDEAPQYERCLLGHQGRVLSVCWEEDMLVSGGCDSSVLIWDTTDHTQRACISVDSVKTTPTLVWQVKILKNSTVVSGDSRGRVSFWDSSYGTLVQSFAQHQADVLCLASHNGTRVWASGVDAQVAEFNYVPFGGQKGGQWVLSASQRSHTRDVHALAVHQFPTSIEKSPALRAVLSEDSGGLNGCVLVSGGLDTQLCAFSGNFRRRPKKIMPLAAYTPVTIAPMVVDGKGNKAIQFLVQQEKDLQLWRLEDVEAKAPLEGEAEVKLADKAVLPAGPYRQLLQIQTSAEGEGLHLCCSALSDDSNWVAASSPERLKLYKLTSAGEEMQVQLVSTRKTLPPASKIAFSHDNRRLVACGLDGLVRVYDLESQEVVATFNQHNHVAAEDDEDDQDATAYLRLLSISPDDRFLASVDDSNIVHVFDLETLEHHCSLPTSASPHTALAFRHNSPMLVTVSASNEVWEYDVLGKRMSVWSRDNQHCLPSSLLKSTDKIFSIVFDASRPRCMLLVANGYMCHIDMDKPASTQVKSKSSSFSKNADTDVSESYRVIKRFKPLLAATFVAPGCMMVAELPWIRVMQNFPPALYRHKYGT